MITKIHIVLEPYKERLCCNLQFLIEHDNITHDFYFSRTDAVIKEFLSTVEQYLSDTLSPEELSEALGTFLFKTCSYDPKTSLWTVHYERYRGKEKLPFKFSLDNEDVTFLYSHLRKQFFSIQRDPSDRLPLYTFNFPPKNFEWCYSPKELAATLEKLCIGRTIQGIYVTATNYVDPLRIRKEHINFLHNPELILQTKDSLLDFNVCARGQIQLRTFDRSECTITGPILNYIGNANTEYCLLGNGFDTFEADYTTASIRQIRVTETNYFPPVTTIDQSKIGHPIALPHKISFELSNHYTLSTEGWDDDFIIQLRPTTPQ